MQKILTREDVSEVPVIGILVLLLLCLVGTSTTNTAFKELPFLIDEAKAIKHKTSPTPSLAPHNPTSSNEDNAIVFNEKLQQLVLSSAVINL